MVNWLTARMKERTSWDGAALVAVGVIGLFFQALVPMNMLCWAAIAYGAWTLWKKEK